LDTILERDFIFRELLGDLNRAIRILPFQNAGQVELMDDALFLVLNDDLAGTVLEAGRRACRNIGVFHMGDELYDADHSYYPSVDYVLRNYYRDDLLTLPDGARCRRVAWVPNGYRSGVGPKHHSTVKPHPQREHLLVFAGCPTTGGPGLTERREMLNEVQGKRLPALVLTTDGFGQGLSVGEYATLMEDAKFALVPGGRCAETIRLYDALEMGAIPITLRHDFLGSAGALPDAPFVFLSSWQDLAAWVAANADPIHNVRHIEQQQRCIAWWVALKQVYRRQVAEMIESSFAAYPAKDH
jgi:hypothetical protein